MNTNDKFLSDIKKAIKFDRAKNGGNYDGKRACEEIAHLLERYCPDVKTLSRQIGDFWLNSFIFLSADIKNEPSEKNIEKLQAFHAFLSDGDDSLLEHLSKDDWENLRDFVDDEAENLDLTSLQRMMALILEHGAL